MPARGEEYGLFWNSSNRDRLYNADSFATLFKKFFTTGVFANELVVTAATGMNVTISDGFVFIEGRIKHFKDDTNIALAKADPTYPRIDAIMAECDFQERTIRLKYVQGTTSASTPSAPAPIRDVEKYQIVLAHIYVGKGVTTIAQSNITDTRLNTELCGMVRGTVDEIDWDQITAQFTSYMQDYKTQKEADFDAWAAAKKQAYDDWVANSEGDYSDWVSAQEAAYTAWINQNESDFLTWYQHMRDQLDQDAAGHLQMEIDDLTGEYQQFREDIEDTLNDGLNNYDKALKGFLANHTEFNADGSITETDGKGYVKHTVFNSDGSITETLSDNNSVLLATKNTVFNSDGSIDETITLPQ